MRREENPKSWDPLADLSRIEEELLKFAQGPVLLHGMHESQVGPATLKWLNMWNFKVGRPSKQGSGANEINC